MLHLYHRNSNEDYTTSNSKCNNNRSNSLNNNNIFILKVYEDAEKGR